FTVEVNRTWAPLGADRFYNMVRAGYFTDVAFFRVISGFMVQFGIHGDPAVSAKWKEARIADDPVAQSNRKGFLTYATAGPGTRTTQLFINYGDNSRLDSGGFAPFGRVTEGMDVVESVYSGYGEGAPSGMGPRQDFVQMKGNAYLKSDFPKLDYILSASLQ
ncbi:MAG: peptidylprolyl isomerase, partial [bacterium]